MPDPAAPASATPVSTSARRYRTLLGFDHGGARIGVAVGEELTRAARPLCTLRAQAGEPDWAELKRLLHEWRPDLLIVGIPRHADGSASKSTTAALAFCEQLRTHTGQAVLTVDERLSSREAEQRLTGQSDLSSSSTPRKTTRRKATRQTARQIQDRIDQAAAAVILETWLQQHHPTG